MSIKRDRKHKPDKQRNTHKKTDKTKYKTRPIKKLDKNISKKKIKEKNP